MVWSLLALALAAELAPISETVRSGRVRERVVDDDADVVIFYAGEHRGRLGTCGCGTNPRGGMARLAGYLDVVGQQQPGTPSMLVHPGRWATDRIGGSLDLSDDSLLQNRAIVRALGQVGFDAVNTSFRDTPFLRTDPAPVGSVSTNGTGLATVQRVRVGELDVAVLGVSRPGSEYLQPNGWVWADPVASVREALVDLQADLVVLLAFDTGADTQDLARIEGIDVLVEAGGHVGKDEPWTEGAVWVRSRDEAQAVGELRIWLDGEGGVRAIRDRWVDLDAWIPEDRGLRKLERQTERSRLKVLAD